MNDLQPQSGEAEQSVLGAVLIDRDVMVEVAELLQPPDFYDARNGMIFAAMRSLHDRRAPIDVVTVTDALERSGHLDTIGGRVYLSSLTKSIPTSVFAGHYAKIVQHKAILRAMIGAAGKVSAIAYEDPASIEDALDRADAVMRTVRERVPADGRTSDPGDIIDRMENERSQGIPTRLPAMNHLTSGLVRGHLVVPGGWSSTGKTAYAVNLMEDVFLAGGSFMVASTEMSQSQYMLRLLSLTSGVPQSLIRHGGMDMDQMTQYQKARTLWKSAKMRLFDDLYSVTRIRRRAKQVKRDIGLDVLFVDFLQNLSETGDEVKDMRLGIVQLQALAKELDCCVVAMSQISNSMAQQQNEEGGFANYYALKGSGAIKDAADVVIMLTRDRVNHPDILVLNIVKNRHGSIGTVNARMTLETGRIEQMSDEDALDANPNSGRRSKRKGTDDQ